MISISRIAYFLLFSLYAIVFLSCADKTEGCLDYSAISIDVTAEKACEKCCQYPKFNLSFVVYDTVNSTINFVRKGDTIKTTRDSLILDKIGFYINDIKLSFNSSGDVLIQDTLGVFYSAEADAEKSLFSLSNARIFSSSNTQVGAFKTYGTIEGLSFNVGVPQNLSAINPYIQTTSSISAGNDSLLVDTSGKLVNFGFEATSITQNKNILIQSNLADIAIDINLQDSYELARGSSLNIVLGLLLADFKNFDPKDPSTFLSVLNRTKVLSISSS